LSKAEAEYKVSSAERDIARQQLENRQLMAPFTGSISEILLKPGAGCAPYQSLVHFVDTSRAFFTGYIEGAQAAKLTKDEPVQVVLDTGQTVAATIWFISPTVDASSGLVKVKALFDNADLKIRPGLSAKLVVQDK
jgi:multidrug efflux pump subunit AcrA (membrane-fusion protein)